MPSHLVSLQRRVQKWAVLILLTTRRSLTVRRLVAGVSQTTLQDPLFLASPAANFVTGVTLNVDGGYMAV